MSTTSGFFISIQMFSYFKNGIKDCQPSNNITIEALVKEIRNNNHSTIQQIRSLDKEDIGYEKKKKSLKQQLPYITPNCTVSYRNDEHIIQFSSYMYFDIDHVSDALSYKKELLDKYHGYITMLCTSSSGASRVMLKGIRR